METKQLNGYKIEFYSEEEWKSDKDGFPIYFNIGFLFGNNHYAGLVSEINEELAEKIVDDWQDYGLLSLNVIYSGYKDYKQTQTYEYDLYPFNTAKESFQTLSDLPYCVIIKTN